MRNYHGVSYVVALALLSGCGGPGPAPMPVGASSASSSSARHSHYAKSWMLREAVSETLLYYTDGGDNVYVLGYPGGKLVGTLTGFDGSQGVCSDANGNVFVTTYSTEDVLEYAHGGTQQIAKLPDYGYYPLGCAVDPVTGNLAVANIEAMNYQSGNVAIYAGAKGKPTDYAAPGVTTDDWVAYDTSGNLYVNGNALAEMPYGSQQFTGISLAVSGDGIQWDGQYLALVNPTSKVVYRIAVSGSSGTVVGTVNFSGLFTRLGTNFALQSGKAVIPFGAGNRHEISRLGLFKYPKGGKLQRSIHRVNFIEDLALSV
jgi:hypothetical protein